METLIRVRQEQAIYLAAGARLFHFSRMHPDETTHLQLLLAQFSPQAGKFYADFGCGIGTVMQKLEQDYQAYTVGLNISPEQSGICLSKNLCIRQGSYVKSGIPDQSIDAVMFFETFGYANPEESLRECRRILKPGGQIWLKDFCFLGTDLQRKEIFKVWRYCFYRREEWAELFRAGGFSLELRMFDPYLDHYIQMMIVMQQAGIQAFVPCADAPENPILTGFAHFTGVAIYE